MSTIPGRSASPPRSIMTGSRPPGRYAWASWSMSASVPTVSKSDRSLRLVQECALPTELLAEFLDVECAGCETGEGREAGGGSCRLPGHPALRDLAHEGLGGGVAGHVAAADDHAVESFRHQGSVRHRDRRELLRRGRG